MLTECTGGQVWRECGSPCTATCDNQNPVCAAVCEKRCQCPINAPIWHNGVCIVNTMCPGYTGGKYRGSYQSIKLNQLTIVTELNVVRSLANGSIV